MLSSALASLTILMLLLSLDYYRKRRRAQINLRPNCLITRYPIVFISGPHSVLYKGNYWNDIPHYLTEHGYDIRTLEPLGRSAKERNESLLTQLEQLAKKETQAHFIIEPRYNDYIGSLKSQQSLRAASINTPPKVVGRTLRTPLQYPISFGHQALTRQKYFNPIELGSFESLESREISSKYLDLAISLAEQDHISQQ